MTVRFNSWLSETETIDEVPYAVSAWSAIQDKPTSVAFRKSDGTTLAAQTVRLESDSSVSESEAGIGSSGPVRKTIIFGVLNHPTVDDTDVEEGYRFRHDGDMWRVVDVITNLGGVRAIAEVTG